MANSVSEVLLTKAHLEAPKGDVDLEAGAIVDFWECAAEKFQLRKVIVYHRLGFVRAGEASLFLQVQTQRREAAFAASMWIVDELKRKVPIWKRPRYKIDNQEQPRSPIPAIMT